LRRTVTRLGTQVENLEHLAAASGRTRSVHVCAAVLAAFVVAFATSLSARDRSGEIDGARVPVFALRARR